MYVTILTNVLEVSVTLTYVTKVFGRKLCTFYCILELLYPVAYGKTNTWIPYLFIWRFTSVTSLARVSDWKQTIYHLYFAKIILRTYNRPIKIFWGLLLRKVYDNGWKAQNENQLR